MADNQPTIPAEDRDPEWDRIRAMTPGLEEEEPPAPAPTEEVTPPAEPPAPETPPEAPTAPEEVPPETPPATDPPADPPQDPPQDPPADPPQVQRPEKYIPLPKYLSEKNEWKEEKERLESQLAAANASGGQAREDAIKKYAEENGVTEDSVRGLIDLFKSTEPTAPAALDTALQEQVERAQEIVAENRYNEEFEVLAVPELKTLFPTATPEQLKAARKELEQIACTEEFLKTPLNKIVLASQKELADIFKVAPVRKGPEQTRHAPVHGTPEYTADDFKEGKTSFDVLFSLPSDQQGKIVEAMDVKTYDAYNRAVQRNDKIVINRGGRKVEA